MSFSSLSPLTSEDKYPTFSEFYKQIGDTKISTNEGKTTVEAKIQWNNKTYNFKWKTSLQEDHINKQLSNKINMILLIGISCNIGEKTSALKYNLVTKKIEKSTKINDYKSKPKEFSFDKKLKKIKDKLALLNNIGENHEKQVGNLNDKIKVINWASSMFNQLALSDEQPKVKGDNESKTTRKSKKPRDKVKIKDVGNARRDEIELQEEEEEAKPKVENQEKLRVENSENREEISKNKIQIEEVQTDNLQLDQRKPEKEGASGLRPLVNSLLSFVNGIDD
jgi:hypothetical protein